MPIPRPALFLAGKAFRRYRSLGGDRTAVLRDFSIGAHAVISQSALITRGYAPLSCLFSRDRPDRSELTGTSAHLPRCSASSMRP